MPRLGIPPSLPVLGHSDSVFPRLVGDQELGGQQSTAMRGWGGRTGKGAARQGQEQFTLTGCKAGRESLLCGCGKFPSWGLNCHCRDLPHELRGPF